MFRLRNKKIKFSFRYALLTKVLKLGKFAYLFFLPSTDLFQNCQFQHFLEYHPSVKNSLKQGQVQHFVGVDLGPLTKFPTNRQRAKQ